MSAVCKRDNEEPSVFAGVLKEWFAISLLLLSKSPFDSRKHPSSAPSELSFRICPLVLCFMTSGPSELYFRSLLPLTLNLSPSDPSELYFLSPRSEPSSSWRDLLPRTVSSKPPSRVFILRTVSVSLKRRDRRPLVTQGDTSGVLCEEARVIGEETVGTGEELWEATDEHGIWLTMMGPGLKLERTSEKDVKSY